MKDAFPRAAAAAGAAAVMYVSIIVGGHAGGAASGSRPAAADQGMVRHATELFTAGRFADALEPTLALTRAVPGSHIYLEQLAGIYHKLDRPKDEAAAWEAFVNTSPSPFEACPQIADAYRREGLMARSVDAADRCLSFAPDDPDMMFYAARGAEWAGRFDRADEIYRRALAVDPGYLDVRIGLARVRLHRDDPAGALADATAILQQKPDAVDALLVAGLALQRQGKRTEARRQFERGLTIAETYPDLHLGLGMIEEDEGHLEAAMRQYQRVLELDPSRRAAADRLARLKAARQ